MSLQGLAPLLIGRSAGRSGRGRRVWGRAEYDSSAWLSTSKPLAATTPAGSVAAASGSTRAIAGRSRREAMPVLAACDRRSKTAMPVHSLPVPVVVGQAR